MLAALLCNLGAGPTPPSPPAPASFFGGGPFRRRFYRDEDEQAARDVRDALPGEVAEVLEEAIETAVQAVRTEPKPEPVIQEARLDYEQALLRVRGELRAEILAILKADRLERKRIDELWAAEIKRRLHEREEEEIACLMCL